MTARFAPADIGADVTALPESERRALAKLVEAAQADGQPVPAAGLGGQRRDAAGARRTTRSADRDRRARPTLHARLHYFLINKGPWSRLDHNQRRSLPGAPAKPEAGQFLSGGRDKAEVETLARLADRRREGARDRLLHHHPARHRRGRLHRRALQRRVPGRAGARRRRCCARPRTLTDAADAEALSHDARRRVPHRTTTTPATSRGWSSTPSIEPTIGPYEVYEDEWFNYKAAFEAFITVRDEAEIEEAAAFSAQLQELENALPIDPKYRNPKLGALAPIRVVNVVFTAGDGNRGVQTAAFNLPNDERVVNEKGTKRVMLKNVQDAKFDKVLVPISQGRARAGRSAERRRSTRSSRTSSCTS